MVVPTFEYWPPPSLEEGGHAVKDCVVRVALGPVEGPVLVYIYSESEE